MQNFESERVSSEVREHADALISQLTESGVSIQSNKRIVNGCNYRLEFHFEENVTVAMGVSLYDSHSNSEVMITTMGTATKARGFGSKTISLLKEWAITNNLKEIRAVQVSNSRSANFWKKNGFIDIGGKTGDFLWTNDVQDSFSKLSIGE